MSTSTERERQVGGDRRTYIHTDSVTIPVEFYRKLVGMLRKVNGVGGWRCLDMVDGCSVEGPCLY